MIWYTQDTGMFLTASHEQTVKLWDANRCYVAYTMELDARVHQIAMAPKTVSHVMVAIATGEAEVSLLDLRSTTITHNLMGHTTPNWAVAWSPANPVCALPIVFAIRCSMDDLCGGRPKEPPENQIKG